MVELPKTEAELQAYVDAQVKAKEESLTADFNNKFAGQRKKHEEEIAKIKSEAGKTAEEIAQQRLKEQQEADAQELNDLRAFRKSTILGDKLAKEGLPTYFKNDTRLLNANESDLDKVIKDVKKEYEATLPKGNTHSTVVGQGGATQVATTDSDKAKVDFGQALKQLVGR